jgi:hypothetical protein
MFQYGAYTPHPDTVAEVRNARVVMGVGGAVALIGALLPSWWMRVGGVGAGVAVWTVGMQRQLKAGVEEKIGKEGIHNALARCASECLIAPVTGLKGYGSVYNRNYQAGQNRYSGTHAPSFG